jgi:hypothetical protein
VKIVHCGLPQDPFEALVLCAPNYCARKFWKKLSTSVIGIKKKLRRLSSVGSIHPLIIEEEATRDSGFMLYLIADFSLEVFSESIPTQCFGKRGISQKRCRVMSDIDSADGSVSNLRIVHETSSAAD